MEQRHNQEYSDLVHAQKQELKNFNNLWDRKLNDYTLEGEKMVKDMEGKHQLDQ